MSTQHPQTSFELSPKNCSDAFVNDVLAIAANFVKEKTQEGWTKADFGKALIDMLDDPVVDEPDFQADSSMDFDAYLKSLVDAAHASVNARADEIIADIRQNHENVMAMLEEREIELINQYWEFTCTKAWQEDHDDKERVIASCLHPYTTFDEWWKNLSDKDRSQWNDDYHQYQWGPNGGEEFSGDFEMAVFSFLNSRDMGLSKLPAHLSWLLIDSEPHVVVNDNLVRYPLKNKWVIEVSLNLVSYDRNVRVLDIDGNEFRSYPDLSLEEIVAEIRKFECD